MGRVAIAPPRDIGRFLRDRRRERGWTLRDVETRSRELGQLIPFTTVAKVERGTVDPGLRRLHVLFRIYDIPPSQLEDLLDLDAFAGDEVVRGTTKEIHERAIAAWKAGDLKQGLAGLAALRARTADGPSQRVERQEALLALAIVINQLGRVRLARTILDELLVEPPEPELLARVLIQAAGCWRRLGSTEMAIALIDRAEGHVSSASAREQAWVQHQKASILATMGRAADARRSLKKAMALYEQAGETYGAARAYGTLVRLEYGEGKHERALAAAREGREFAHKRGHPQPATLRLLEEGRVLTDLGRQDEALAALSTGLGEAVGTGDPVTQFYAHYCLWKAYEKAGERDRAAVELQTARYFVKHMDAALPEVMEVRQGMTDSPLAAAGAAASERSRGERPGTRSTTRSRSTKKRASV